MIVEQRLKTEKRITMETLSDEGCINLLRYLVETVCLDYTRAFGMYLENKTLENIKHRNELREYITSQYFCNLTNLDGERVVEMIEERVRRNIRDRYNRKRQYGRRLR